MDWANLGCQYLLVPIFINQRFREGMWMSYGGNLKLIYCLDKPLYFFQLRGQTTVNGSHPQQPLSLTQPQWHIKLTTQG